VLEILTHLLDPSGSPRRWDCGLWSDEPGWLHLLSDLESRRGGREVALRIRDNGIGIAPEMLTRIFDLFVQVDRRVERSQGGVGIGLTLVRKPVELHSGTVEAFSEGLGRGSEFVVRLPAPVA
jgi:signal transduction histidine kinase